MRVDNECQHSSCSREVNQIDKQCILNKNNNQFIFYIKCTYIQNIYERIIIILLIYKLN